MNNKKIKITKENLIELLNDYYKEENGKVSIKTTKEKQGIYEDDVCVTTVKVTKSIVIGNKKFTVEEKLTVDELTSILGEMLKSSEYEVVRIDILNRLENRTEGYYLNEKTISYPVFNGIEVYVKEKSKKLIR